jgi:hypothetical protein
VFKVSAKPNRRLELRKTGTSPENRRNSPHIQLQSSKFNVTDKMDILNLELSLLSKASPLNGLVT